MIFILSLFYIVIAHEFISIIIIIIIIKKKSQSFSIISYYIP